MQHSEPGENPEKERDVLLEAMQQSHKQATAVLTTIEAIWGQFDEDAQAILQDVLDACTSDIALLGTYTDIAEHEYLTEEEKEVVAALLLDIQDAIEILASAMDNLL